MEVLKVAKRYGRKILTDSLKHCKYESTLPGTAGCFTIEEIFGTPDKASIM